MDIKEIEKLLVEEVNKMAASKGYKGRASAEGNSLNVPNDLFFSSEGRKPGKQPPLFEILKWVKEKGIGNKDIATAYVIARAIGRRGIKGSFWLDEAINLGLIQVDDYVNKTMEEEINNLFN